MAVCCAGPGLDSGRETDGLDAAPGHGMIVLGRQLADPYSVENMTQALAAVYPTKAAARVLLPATHYYVRFLPANEAQYALLEKMGLELMDHPMDFEIVREGDWHLEASGRKTLHCAWNKPKTVHITLF